MRRVLALLVLASVVVALPLPVQGQTAVAYVDGVTVSPEQPNVGERFVVTASIRNAQSASAPLTINAVAVRTSQDSAAPFREYVRVNDLGRLPPGTNLEVPLSLSLSRVGTHDLRVVVFAEDDRGAVRIQYPLVVTVRESGPQLRIDVTDAVEGTESPVQVVAVNGEAEPVRNVRLTLEGEGATVGNDTWLAPSLAAGESRRVTFQVTPTAPDASLTATLRYVTAGGTTRTVRQAVSFAAEPLREDVRLDASVERRGASPPVVVDVSNLGNAPLEEVVVSVRADGDVVARRPLADVADGETRSVALNVSGVSEVALEVTAAYETGGRSGSAVATVAYASNPGRIELTGIDIERVDGRVHIEGSASNVGLSEVDGVVLRVLDTDGVSPARPYRDYFVGTVPASDFVSFDLYAEVDDGVTAVPVEVTYLSDGDRTTAVTQVDVSDLPAEANSGESGGRFPVNPLLFGVVGLLFVAVVGAGLWYRSRT